MNCKIICTLGPSSFKKSILKELKYLQVNIFRINMSHTSIEDLEHKIIFLKNNNIKNICIDTEGAQLRTTKTTKRIYLDKNKIIKISNEPIGSNNKIINIYPKVNLNYFKTGMKLDIGFEGLSLKVLKKDSSKNFLISKVISDGYLESNKGVHAFGEIKLNSLTEKDLKAIKIAQKYNIKFYAMSFVNKGSDVERLRKLIRKKDVIISKIETKNSLKNLSIISSKSNALLIDRGDLSRYISIDKIPIIQEAIAQVANKMKKPLYVATNLLETMIKETSPTRAESNDIYSTLKQGAQGLVLAAETAIGNNPVGCVKFLKKCLYNFNKEKIKQIKKIVK
jgi:pyruvate kinase